MANTDLLQKLMTLMQGRSPRELVALLSDAAPYLPGSTQLPIARIDHALRAVDAIHSVRRLHGPITHPKARPPLETLTALTEVLDRRGFIAPQAPLSQIRRSLGQVHQMRTMLSAMQTFQPAAATQAIPPALPPSAPDMSGMAQGIRRVLSGITPEQREQLQSMAQDFFGH